ncbi:hypothetical protein [Qipengyuania nanhaisediminis]|uniref:Phytoene synthase n=1 Tax=Qipengyuania nanhaisediminis TaxID=604088 RepID=A0A1I5MJR8_9SPHN|nr:hypothetical protein [Qipengyuania nanhaisediminis]SFP09743.1 phytoene synthase [Qipengyuania nanhaisediminis]
MVETAQTRQQDLAEEVQLALAYARPADRPLLRSMFELDRRLAGVVATSSETVIGQMRLAWWRDLLCKPASERPLGEPLVTSISDAWGEEAEALTKLVDGWEALLVAEALEPETLDQFCKGRASAWSAAVRGLGFAEAEQDNARLAGYRWALADLAAHLSDENERNLVLSRADTTPGHGAMHRRARPLAILSGLAERSLTSGGKPLLEGRGAALLALRIGISGR